MFLQYKRGNSQNNPYSKNTYQAIKPFPIQRSYIKYSPKEKPKEREREKMASSIPSIKVIRCEPELVRPSKPTPREVKLLSDIDDQEGLRFQVPVIFFYKNNISPSAKGRDPIEVIREALGRALVYYYPLAGRLREGFNRKLSVDCTGEGVLFVAAEADVGFDELGDAIRPPCPFLDEFLASVTGTDETLGCPLLLFQVRVWYSEFFFFFLPFLLLYTI